MTVVVPARDEEASIGGCLDSVLAQTHRNLQVIVVDGASRDRTADIVRGYAQRDPRVELLSNPQRIVPVALNLALAAARGRWLVRVDAHATVPTTYVARTVAHLRTGRWGGVGGRKDGVGVTAAGKAVAAAMGSRFGVGNSTYHHGTEPQVVDHIPFGAYPVELVRELDGWDEHLAVNQDYEFDYRLRQTGHELLFDPALVIEWQCRQSVRDLFRQYRRYGRGKVAVLRLHPASASVRHLAAPALVASWVVAALGVPWWPLVSVALVVPYAAALAVASGAVARRLRAPRARRWVPAAFVAMHAGWGLGFWEAVARTVVRPRADPRSGPARPGGRVRRLQDDPEMKRAGRP